MTGAVTVGPWVSPESRSAAALVEEIPVIEMVAPMPGFPGFKRFTLVQLDDIGALYALTSVDDPELRFLVVPASMFFPDDQPEVEDAAVAALAIARPEDVLALLVVNPGESAAGATVNLLAPVLLNSTNRLAAQVVLTDDLPVRAPLLVASRGEGTVSHGMQRFCRFPR